jgi:hypothetical protein
MKELSLTDVLNTCFILRNGVLDSEKEHYYGLLKEALTSYNPKFQEIIFKNLPNINDLPKDLAIMIAYEDYPLSCDVLKYYPNFSERELLDFTYLINNNNKLKAIAQRQDLTEKILLSLDHKNISIQEVDHHDSEIELSLEDEEEANIDYESIRRNIDNLYAKNNLTDIMIVNYLCKGEFFSFCYAVSKITDFPQNYVKDLIAKPSSNEFKELYETMGFNANYFDSIKVILSYYASHYSNVTVSASKWRKDLYSYLSKSNLYEISNINFFLQLIKL